MTVLAGADKRRSLERFATIPFSGAGESPFASGEFEANAKERIKRLANLALNDSPRAGQRFEITNMFYRFPEATKRNEGLSTVPWEYEFSISAFIDGTLIAEQKILETQTTAEQEQRQKVKFEGIPFRAVGSLEPFAPPIIYPGKSLRFVLGLSVNGIFFQEPAGSKLILKDGRIVLGPGEILINYNRIVR